MIKGLFYIFLFNFLGNVVSLLIKGFIPGSVIGMILLFVCLFFKIIDPENVRETATVITKNMAIFFVPSAVGLMAYAEVLSGSIWTITFSIIISTVLTIVVVALVQERFEKRKNRKEPLS